MDQDEEMEHCANDTELKNHEYFRECIDSAKKLGSISLDLSYKPEHGRFSSADFIYLSNQLKDSNIENINLEDVSLDGNEVTEIFDVLKYTKIKQLNLKSNEFSIGGLSALSFALKESQIQVLNLSNNYGVIKCAIPILTNSLPFSNVTSLDLGSILMNFYCFQHLSDTLAYTKITALCLNFCYLGDEYLEYLFTKLNNSKIKSLHIKGNRMSFDSFKLLANVLENTAITELNISCNRIGPTGAIYLAGKLNKSLVKNLDIGYNEIKSEGCSAIGNVIHLTKIIKLNLQGNSIGSSGITSLAENLKKSNVKYLNFKGNNLDINGSQILADGIKDSDLKYLNVDWNKLTNVGMGIILDALQLTKISNFHLDCASNGMKAENMKFVTNAFQFFKLKNLEVRLPDDENIVRLFFNELKTLIESHKFDEILSIKNKMNLIVNYTYNTQLHYIITNAEYVFDVIKHFHMKKLIFSHRYFNHVSSVVEMLKNIRNPISDVKTLDLSYNTIGNEDAAILAKNLKYLKLTRLELNTAGIKNDGVIAVANALKNSQIKYLSLAGNPFNSIGASYLANVVEKHPVKIVLDKNDENGFSAEEQLVIKNINCMFLRAQLLVRSISENSLVQYDKHLIEYFKAYEIFKDVDLLWQSRFGVRKYDYNRINAQIRSNVTKNFLKIIGVVNSDEIDSASLPSEVILKIFSYLKINDIKFN